MDARVSPRRNCKCHKGEFCHEEETWDTGVGCVTKVNFRRTSFLTEKEACNRSDRKSRNLYNTCIQLPRSGAGDTVRISKRCLVSPLGKPE